MTRECYNKILSHIHYDFTKPEKDEKKRRSRGTQCPGQLSKDKSLVVKLKIPLDIEDIIHTSMEGFNDLVCKQGVTEEQINICRDIRRRGKNKVSFNINMFAVKDKSANSAAGLFHARNRKEKRLSERVKLLWMKQEMMRMLDRLDRFILDRMGIGEGWEYLDDLW